VVLSALTAIISLLHIYARKERIMAKFATPSTDNVELAGPLTEFTDKLVALQAQGSLVKIGTKFGPADALRVQVVDPITGEDKGIRLLFWRTMMSQITAVHAQGDDWAVGVITQTAQKEDADKSFYSLTVPEDGVDWGVVGAGLDKFEAAARSKTHPTAVVSEEAPF
jgi:hypothetical protein